MIIAEFAMMFTCGHLKPHNETLNITDFKTNMAKILLIDDDDGFRKMLKTAVEKEGHRVIEASNGEEGYRVFMEQPCDLIITDIFMPVKEGIHTIFEFKSDFPDTPVIAVSGGGIMAKKADMEDTLIMVNSTMNAEEILELASDFGADHVVSKPISIDGFLKAIDSLLSIDD